MDSQEAPSPAQVAYNTVTRNLQEVLHGEVIRTAFAEGRAPKIYWGMSATFRDVLMGGLLSIL